MTGSQNRVVQREEGGSSELATQNRAVQREVGGRVSWLRSITLDFMSQSLFFQRLSQEKIPGQGIRKVIRGLAMRHRLKQILRSFWRRLMRQLRGQKLLSLTQARRNFKELSVGRDC